MNSTNLSNDSAIEIGNLIKNSQEIEKLIIDSNNFGIEGAGYIAEGLKINSTIRTLSIQNCNIENEGLILLADSFTNRTNICEINISNNFITEKGFKYFSEILHFSNISRVITNNNPIKDESISNILIYLTSPKCKLKKLEMKNCKFSDKGLNYLITSSKNITSLM